MTLVPANRRPPKMAYVGRLMGRNDNFRPTRFSMFQVCKDVHANFSL